MMASASPSPKSPEISEKSKRYDRQLRLWGDHGQNRLETSQICLINANATGTEILKSLVLPGCGNFTIIDGHEVTQEDLGNNFFLDADSLGINRAKASTRLILELNSDVNGVAIEDHPESILNLHPTFFNRFSIVIGCMLSEKTLVALSRILWDNNVPFLYVHCIGLVGWIRLQISEHAVIESHPDNVKEDLRLDTPFPEIIAYMDSIKIKEWKQPWVTLLFRAWQSFKLRGDTCESTEQSFNEYIQEYCVAEGLQVDEGFSTVMSTMNGIPFHDLPQFIETISENRTEAWVPNLLTAFRGFLDSQNSRRKEEFLSFFSNKYLQLMSLDATSEDYLEAVKAVSSSTYPSLVEYMDSISKEIRQPWLVLLYKAVQSYSMQNKPGGNQNGGGMDTTVCHPCNMTNRKDKEEFKDYLGQYLCALGLETTDEVYEEVMGALNKTLTPTKIPCNVQEILNDRKSFKPESSEFWIMCAALKEFIRENNHLPVRGSLPDMTADSQKYIALQQIYRDKAVKDSEDIYNRCQQLIAETSIQQNKVTIKPDDARLFCKEVFNLRLIRGQPFYEELQGSPNTILRDLADNMEDCDPNKIYYVMLRGVLRFHSEYNTYPGLLDNDVEPDIARFKSCMNRMLTEWNTSSAAAKEDFIHEICRYGAAEIPSIAAFIGGCAAQEVIKIITSQYVPLNHTLIYNAINCTTSTFEVI